MIMELRVDLMPEIHQLNFLEPLDEVIGFFQLVQDSLPDV